MVATMVGKSWAMHTDPLAWLVEWVTKHLATKMSRKPRPRGGDRKQCHGEGGEVGVENRCSHDAKR